MWRSGRKPRAAEVKDVERGGSDPGDNEKKQKDAFEDAKHPGAVPPFGETAFPELAYVIVFERKRLGRK